MKEKDTMLNISQAAKCAGVTIPVMNLWMAKGYVVYYEYPSDGFKRFIRIKKSDLDTFMESRKKGAA